MLKYVVASDHQKHPLLAWVRSISLQAISKMHHTKSYGWSCADEDGR